MRALGATGAIDAPDGPVLLEIVLLETSGIVATASALLRRARSPASRWWCVVGALRPARAACGGARYGSLRRLLPGVEGLVVATGAFWLCGLAMVALAAEPVRRGRAGPGDAPAAVRRLAAGADLLPGLAGPSVGGSAGTAASASTTALALDLGLIGLAFVSALAAWASRSGSLPDAAGRVAAGGAGRRDPGPEPLVVGAAGDRAAVR